MWEKVRRWFDRKVTPDDAGSKRSPDLDTDPDPNRGDGKVQEGAQDGPGMADPGTVDQVVTIPLPPSPVIGGTEPPAEGMSVRAWLDRERTAGRLIPQEGDPDDSPAEGAEGDPSSPGDQTEADLAPPPAEVTGKRKRGRPRIRIDRADQIREVIRATEAGRWPEAAQLARGIPGIEVDPDGRTITVPGYPDEGEREELLAA